MNYPDRTKIRAEIEDKILNGQISIPQNYILDSKEYVDGLAKDEFKKQRKLWDEFQETERKNFRAELEDELLGEKTFSQSQKDALWDFAWREGHSGGDGDVRNKYIDLLDFALIILSDK
jgi:hypothetical protein